MLRNLASSLFLTERETDDLEANAPKVKGRVVTTLEKAKEVRPLVEKCVTIARRSLTAQETAKSFGSNAERNSSAWKTWRQSENWQKWNAAMAPAVAARRRALQLLGDKQAVRILFDDIAPRMSDRDGGYTRILRLAKPRLGDAGTRAIIEFVGKNDRVTIKSEKPAFDDDLPADDLDTTDKSVATADEGAVTDDPSKEAAEEKTDE